VDIEDLLSAMGGGARRPRQPRRGQDVEYQLTLDFLQAVNGVTTTIQVPKPTDDGQFTAERIEVHIPPGVQDGSRIRLRAKGQPGSRGGPAGDLYIVARVLEHPYYRRMGNDIYIDLPITVTEALVGGKVEVPTLDGMTLLKVPPGATSGVRLRLKGKGVRTAQGERGDEYAVVKIVAPKMLSEKGKELAAQLAQTDPYNPRKGLW
jgi:curved DNA-binding protein